MKLHLEKLEKPGYVALIVPLTDEENSIVKHNLYELYQAIYCEAVYDPTNEQQQLFAIKLLPKIQKVNQILHFKE